jgi:hypothetical protein
MSVSEPFPTREDPVAAPEEIVKAVAELAEKSGHKFAVTAVPVDGTQLYVVYAADHPFPDRYTVVSGMLGFRVSSNRPRRVS